MGHQGTLGIATEADARARQASRGRVLGLLRLPVLPRRLAGDGRVRALRRGDARRRRPLRRVEARVPPPRRRGVHPAARERQGRRGSGHVRQRGRGASLGEADPADRQGGRRQYLGDEISQGDWASRHDRYATPQHGRTPGRPGGAHELALRGRVDPLLAAPGRTREVARDRRRPAQALRHVRRLGHVRVHERGVQAVGRLPHRDRRRHLGDEVGRRELGGLGGREAGDRPGRDRARRLDLRLPRRLPRGRGRPRPGGAGRRLRRDEEDQAGARSEQRHEPRQVPARPGVRGGER